MHKAQGVRRVLARQLAAHAPRNALELRNAVTFGIQKLVLRRLAFVKQLPISVEFGAQPFPVGLYALGRKKLNDGRPRFFAMLVRASIDQCIVKVEYKSFHATIIYSL